MDVARTLYVTEHYAHLQGLRLVPLGLLFLTSSAWRAGYLGWLPWTAGHGASRWFAAGMAVALAASVVIGTSYRRRVGAALPKVTGSGAVTLVGFFAGLGVLTVTSKPWPLSLPLLFVTFALGYLGCAAHGLRRHYLAIAAACLLFAMAPLFGMSPATRRVTRDLLIGLGLVVAGWGDHVSLQRELRAQQGVRDDRAA